ncbi:hypothetical protein EV715DRAFT_256037, partial [Schizophyllum commune]
MMSVQGDSTLRCFYHNESRRVCYTPLLSAIPHVPSSSPAPPSRRDPHDTYRTALLPPLEGPSTSPREFFCWYRKPPGGFQDQHQPSQCPHKFHERPSLPDSPFETLLIHGIRTAYVPHSLRSIPYL